MSGWRGRQREIASQESQNTRSRSKNGKPPSGSWQQTVPSWEKKFCYKTCSISWRKLLETKRLMEFYDNIVKWDDSAGEEAFQNGKARYWAKINGLLCNIPLPDPDMYMAEIDWDSEIDPELVADLDRLPPSTDASETDIKPSGLYVGWDSNEFTAFGWGDAEEPIKPTGWGDEEEPVQATGWGDDVEEPVQATGWGGDVEEPVQATGWGGDVEEPIQATGWGDAVEEPVQATGWGDDVEEPVQATGWGDDVEEPVQATELGDVEESANATGWGDPKEPVKATGWEDGEDPARPVNDAAPAGLSRGNCNKNSNYYDGWYGDDNYTSSNNTQDCNNRETPNQNSWRRVGGSKTFYKNRTSRHECGDDSQVNNNRWRDSCGRKKANFVFEKPETEKKTLASMRWVAMRSCGPRDHHHNRTPKVGNA